jgi:ribosomal protein S18 acetylase RimI-like enzyme
MRPTELTLQLATDDDFSYSYCLCELTMRSYVEADLGDCFEQVARPTIQKLLQRGLFSRIYANDVLVGAVAYERHDTYIQLEEIYIESAKQNQGLGTEVMKRFIDQSRSLVLPIRLHVLSSNPARVFYEKLGFRTTQSTKEVSFMEYVPETPVNDELAEAVP